MKVSEVTLAVLCEQLRENPDELSESEKAHIEILKDAALDDIKHWTGIGGIDEPDENGRKLDDYPGITRALLAVVSFDYDNRIGVADKYDREKILQATLHLNDFNLVSKSTEETA